ncbi:membrane-spanning 4-domains subfamily A member 8-like isoform X2 [Heterodontus francisci]|uniref:membrane-spanning 4-domains subfamily A member 8-like isoform X2 n=1 Tax=Heterodontus francisci TaxID=7792 RepID=UPI00355C01EE
MATLTSNSGKPLTNPADSKLSGRDLPVRMETPHSHSESRKITKQFDSKGRRIALGVAQVMLGLVFITLGIPLILSPESFAAKIGTPWWGGTLFIISGITSIVGEKKPKRSVLRTCAVLNLLSATAALSVSLLFSVDLRMWVPHLVLPIQPTCKPNDLALSESQFTLRIILLIFALMELSISTVVATIGWKAVWKCSRTSKDELAKDLSNADPDISQLAKDLSNADPTYESLILREPTYTPMSALRNWKSLRLQKDD